MMLFILSIYLISSMIAVLSGKKAAIIFAVISSIAAILHQLLGDTFISLVFSLIFLLFLSLVAALVKEAIDYNKKIL